MGTFSSSKLAGGVKKNTLWWLGWSLVIVLGLVLGAWQWQRAEDKRNYLERLEAAPALVMPDHAPSPGSDVQLSGHLLAEETLFLDNRVRDGRVGVAVLTPLIDLRGQRWLIERGFVATGPRRHDPVIATPKGRVTVQGQWQAAGKQAPLFGPNREGRRLQRIELAAWHERGGFAYPGWLHQARGPGSFAPWWAPSVMPPSRHIGYAVQWWGLALAAAAVMWWGRARTLRTKSVERGS